MTVRSVFLNDELHDYMTSVSVREPAALAELRAASSALEEHHRQAAPEQAQLIVLLARLVGARKAIEVGTFRGYTTLALALALPAGGRVVTCELEPELVDWAGPFWAKAGVADRIDARIGQAADTLAAILAEEGPDSYDLAFLDADKVNHDRYYELIIQLVRPGGLIVFDNVFWGGMVIDPAKTDEHVEAIRALNRKLHTDERISLSTVPLGDGMTMARKRGADEPADHIPAEADAQRAADPVYQPVQRADLPIFDPGFKADPQPVYTKLREDGPLSAIRLPTGAEAWLVTEYRTARELLNDPRLSKDSVHAGPSWHQAHPTYKDGTSKPVFRSLITIDPPDHTRLRSMVAREFTARRIEKLRPQIEAMATELVDAMAERGGTVDLIADFALPLPLRVICALIGVPAQDYAKFGRWSALLTTADKDEQALIPVAAAELHDYLLALMDVKRHQPDESLFSALVATHDDGQMSEDELAALGFMLLVAGHETTVHLIGNGVLLLLDQPETWRRLCHEPSIAGNVVEELLRIGSPVDVATPRFAKEQVHVGDTVIEPGDVVLVCLSAANQDGGHFSAADRIDVDRDVSAHLAFGHGIHYCVGAPLARAEGDIALRLLSERFPDLRPAVAPDELRWRPGLVMRGLHEFPVVLQPGALPV